MTPAATQPLAALPVAVLDSETTGLDATVARLLQVAVVNATGEAIESNGRFETLVNPGVPIPAASSAVHGITDADVVSAPPAARAIPELLDFIGERVVVGHTIAYDLEILKREAARAGIAWRQPRTLDVRLLARMVAPRLADYSLDGLCAWLGIVIEGRHRAMGDAFATARLYTALVPLLRGAGVRTLAEAETGSRLASEREAVAAGDLRAVPAPAAAEESPPHRLARIDSYPFSHRVAEAMSAPPVSIALDGTLADAVALLTERRISSVFVIAPDGERGIVTERDVLRTLGARREAALDAPLREIWSHPLQCVRSDAFIYRAIGRMTRLGVRHLGVVDTAGDLVGAVTTRQLLRHRTSEAMMLGDEIAAGADGVALSAAWAKLPAVAEALSEEGVAARQTAEVISAELRMLTRRAAQLSEARLAETGRGPPPVAYAVLVLGSGGRGESLLSADQDNAIVYASGAPDGTEDRWFAEMAGLMADILDQSGVPYCKGGVMARNPLWRGSLPAWQARVEEWIGRKRPEDLLNVDIFFDAVPVHGDAALGEALLSHAYARGAERPTFWRALGETLLTWRSPVGLFGGLRTEPNGRLDLKRYGLLPLFTAARIVAIRTNSPQRSTPERLLAAPAHDLASPDSVERMIAAQGVLLDAMLRQQLADSRAGIAPSPRVDPRILGKRERAALADALRQVPRAIDLVREGML